MESYTRILTVCIMSQSYRDRYNQDHSFSRTEQPYSPNGNVMDQRLQHPGLRSSVQPQQPAPDVNPLQTAGQILAKRITTDDVQNKLMELQEQFRLNSLRRQEMEDNAEPEPEPEAKDPDMSLEDVLVDLSTKQDDPDTVLNGLHQLYRWLQTEEFNSLGEGLHGLLLSMVKHPRDNRIQMIGSSCLLVFLNGKFTENLTDKNRTDMLLAVLDCLDFHANDAALTRRCCSCLELFDIPYDMLLEIDRVVQVLVRIVTPPHEKKFVRLECIDMAIGILDKLSLPHPDLNKPFEANLGALSVHAMLEIIIDRLTSETQECDKIMETAWSILWNVTQDTPENCIRFMTSNGLDIFQDCMKVFHDQTQLHVSMFGLMTNLADTKYVRNQLMKSDLAEVIATVWEFMNSADPKLSYCVCSVMARLVADGTASWKISSPTHKDTCERIVQTIASWNMNKSGALHRGCTLLQILRLITMTSSPEAQYWATWTICSLVKNNTNKYCLLLERERGLSKLEALIRSNTSDVIKELANQSLDIYDKYKENQK